MPPSSGKKMQAAGSPKAWLPTEEPQAVRFKVKVTKGMFRKGYALLIMNLLNNLLITHSDHSTDHIKTDCLYKHKTLHFTLTVFPPPYDSHKKQQFLHYTAFSGWSF